MRIDFDMVIPHYMDEVLLSELLHDIITTNKKYKPNNIHILNDGDVSDDLVTVLTEYSKHLPLKIYECEKSGHTRLIHDFVLKSEVENILISHADVSLKPNNPSIKYNDPISVVAFYLCDSDDIVGISCNAVFNGEGLKDIVAQADTFISNGMRQIARGYLTTLYRGFKSNFPLESMLGQHERVVSFDDKFYGLKTSSFKELEGFSENFMDYIFYLDDYFCRARRDLDKHALFTNETAVKHGVTRDKPKGVFEFNQEKHIVFNDTWMKTSYVHTSSLMEGIIKEELMRLS